MNKLSNLECIKKGWAMGFSATLTFIELESQVVSVLENYNAPNNTVIQIRYNSSGLVSLKRESDVDEYKITGWLYVGELAGNEIPEGQEFVTKKKHSEIYRAIKQNHAHCQIVLLDEEGTEVDDFDKCEIEPYFG